MNKDNTSGAPIRVEVLRRSMYGGYMGKVYIFKNRRHMEAWRNKWEVKLGVDQFVITSGDDNHK